MALATLLKGATPTPEEEELRRKQVRLSELETQLADRELELASLLAELVHSKSGIFRRSAAATRFLTT